MTVPTNDLRAAMITAAERQLVNSPDGDIATRAVCEAVGVTQPVLYRLFGDKRGLLDALADHGLQRYAALKAAQTQTADPVADLKSGWAEHMQFAAENPALYQLMFVPRPWSQSFARERIYDLLVATLTRCAAAGRLETEPRVAAQLILSANVGVALNQMAQPDLFNDSTLSQRMRDAVFGSLLRNADPPQPAEPLRAAALRLHSQLSLSDADADADALDPPESALLRHWLHRIVGADSRL